MYSQFKIEFNFSLNFIKCFLKTKNYLILFSDKNFVNFMFDKNFLQLTLSL